MTQFEIIDALSVLRPNALWSVRGNTYASIIWSDTTQSKPSEQEVNDQITANTVQAPFVACVNKSKELLAASDWSVLPDVNISNKAEFEAYRAELRVLMFNPVESPVFPTEPQPVWI
jgi:hypothetical protein